MSFLVPRYQGLMYFSFIVKIMRICDMSNKSIEQDIGMFPNGCDIDINKLHA